MKMLTLTTNTEGRGKVLAHCDAVLYHDPEGYYRTGGTPRFRAPRSIYAMSIIGPEQTIRAIAAGCALEEVHQRTELVFEGESGLRVSGRWAPAWGCQAKVLTHGIMHMVAMPTQTHEGAERQNQVIIPPDGDTDRAIYQRLLTSFTTPLIPLGLPGQGIEEIAAAREWCSTITGLIQSKTDYWHPLDGHRDQDDTTWAGAGLLRITEIELDELVSGLVQRKRLTIPAAVKRQAEAA